MKKVRYPPDLFMLLDAYDSADLSEGTALQLLMDAVGFYNVKNSTSFDPKHAVDAWILDRNEY